MYDIDKKIEIIKALSDDLVSKCKEVLFSLRTQTVSRKEVECCEEEMTDGLWKGQVELKSYDTMVICKNCGLHGKISVPFGKTIREYSRDMSCPKCGTDNLFPVGSDSKISVNVKRD